MISNFLKISALSQSDADLQLRNAWMAQIIAGTFGQFQLADAAMDQEFRKGFLSILAGLSTPALANIVTNKVTPWQSPYQDLVLPIAMPSYFLAGQFKGFCFLFYSSPVNLNEWFRNQAERCVALSTQVEALLVQVGALEAMCSTKDQVHGGVLAQVKGLTDQLTTTGAALATAQSGLAASRAELLTSRAEQATAASSLSSAQGSLRESQGKELAQIKALAELAQRHTSAAQVHAQAIEQLKTTHEAALSAVRKEMATLQASTTAATKLTAGQIARLQNDIELAKKSLAEQTRVAKKELADAVKAAQEGVRKEAQTELDALTAKREALQKNVDTLKGVISGLEKTLAARNAEIAKLKAGAAAALAAVAEGKLLTAKFAKQDAILVAQARELQELETIRRALAEANVAKKRMTSDLEQFALRVVDLQPEASGGRPRVARLRPKPATAVDIVNPDSHPFSSAIIAEKAAAAMAALATLPPNELVKALEPIHVVAASGKEVVRYPLQVLVKMVQEHPETWRPVMVHPNFKALNVHLGGREVHVAVGIIEGLTGVSSQAKGKVLSVILTLGFLGLDRGLNFFLEAVGALPFSSVCRDGQTLFSMLLDATFPLACKTVVLDLLPPAWQAALCDERAGRVYTAATQEFTRVLLAGVAVAAPDVEALDLVAPLASCREKCAQSVAAQSPVAMDPISFATALAMFQSQVTRGVNLEGFCSEMQTTFPLLLLHDPGLLVFAIRSLHGIASKVVRPVSDLLGQIFPENHLEDPQDRSLLGLVQDPAAGPLARLIATWFSVGNGKPIHLTDETSMLLYTGWPEGSHMLFPPQSAAEPLLFAPDGPLVSLLRCCAMVSPEAFFNVICDHALAPALEVLLARRDEAQFQPLAQQVCAQLDAYFVTLTFADVGIKLNELFDIDTTPYEFLYRFMELGLVQTFAKFQAELRALTGKGLVDSFSSFANLWPEAEARMVFNGIHAKQYSTLDLTQDDIALIFAQIRENSTWARQMLLGLEFGKSLWPNARTEGLHSLGAEVALTSAEVYGFGLHFNSNLKFATACPSRLLYDMRLCDFSKAFIRRFAAQSGVVNVLFQRLAVLKADFPGILNGFAGPAGPVTTFYRSHFPDDFIARCVETNAIGTLWLLAQYPELRFPPVPDLQISDPLMATLVAVLCPAPVPVPVEG